MDETCIMYSGVVGSFSRRHFNYACVVKTNLLLNELALVDSLIEYDLHKIFLKINGISKVGHKRYFKNHCMCTFLNKSVHNYSLQKIKNKVTF